jgi:hypothetical protein
VATLYFCHRCAKLHHWHRCWSRSITPWYKESIPCKGGEDNDDLVISHLRFIPYSYARWVMNRHFYGSTHGLPIKKFEERTLLLRYSDGFVEKISQHARIVDRQLLVSSTITMAHSRGDSASLRRHVGRSRADVCTHLVLSRCHEYNGTADVPELVKDAATQNEFRPCEQSFGSCVFCLTDYRFDIQWQGPKKGYIIKMLVYRQLGDCRSPLDWTWRARVDPQMEQKTRTAYSPEYGPGYVRNQWNKVDGIASRTPGAWVQVPGTVVGVA